MSQFISDLLQATEPTFSLALRQLEKQSGKPKVDIKLQEEIIRKAEKKTKELGLDPKDTTGRELFHALEDRIREDNERVTKLIGGTDHNNIKAMVPLMIKTANKAKIPKSCWVLKRSAAKNLLRKMPPKKMMKHLGYRSIDSMLKREPFDEMYSALRFSEGGEWLDAYNELFKTIKPTDFETRKINIIEMDHDKWVDLTEHFVEKKRHNVTHTKELGTIIVVPMKQEKKRGITLVTLPLLFHYINEIRLYSAFFKLKSTQPNFGEEFVDTLIADPGNAAIMAGQNVHWRVIQRYFGKLSDEKHPEAFEPHVQPEDLHWRKAEESMYDLDPKLEFWQDMDYVAKPEKGGPVAFNMLDVSFAYSNEETYKNRYSYHFREALWNEVFMRYMGQRTLEDQILKQLDNDLIEPEDL